MNTPKTEFFLVFILFLCIYPTHPARRKQVGLKDNRPPPSERKFVSSIIEKIINQTANKMKDPKLALLWTDCYPNTLDTTVEKFQIDPKTGKPDTFIITGDIPAMWLRDSSAQVHPYLEFVGQDPTLKDMIRGVINRQAKSIILDSYANAFTLDTNHYSSDDRYPPMKPGLWEGKYELDSLAWVMKLSADYYAITQDSSLCSDRTWLAAVDRIIATIKYQQKSTDSMKQFEENFYSFSRTTTTQTETLIEGIGVPASQCGLSRSPFRPSDDAHRNPFPIAANAMAAVNLKTLAKVISSDSKCRNDTLAAQLSSLGTEIQDAIYNYGVVQHPFFGKIFAYEVDGFGSFYAMDDANIPSLLSLPYLGFVKPDDPIYIQTRRYLFSDKNPYFFQGTAASGIGSPHTGIGKIWHLGIIMRAITSTDDKEILDCLETLKNTDANTGFMHESFSKDNAADFTRPWFAWANSQFGYLILKVARERPHLLFQ